MRTRRTRPTPHVAQYVAQLSAPEYGTPIGQHTRNRHAHRVRPAVGNIQSANRATLRRRESAELAF